MPKRFRIALSFAGEKRDFVHAVATLLAAKFGEDKILYDKYHEAEFAVFDLGIRLPVLYGEQSDLIVPILCPAYDTKRWTGWEWVHIYGLLTKADGHRVMPCRFEFAQVEGLSPASGFIELDDKTPDQLATLILERLALNEGHPKDHYKTAVPGSSPPPALRSSTPNNLPRLQSFFGREKELAVIREALDPESRTWGALIDGIGGMGKTSLAIRAAYDCPPGQFDRIVFVSVKDREMDDDGVRTLGWFLIPGLLEMLNELARELGHPDIPKSPEDQRIRLLLDALRDTRTLLILDNLESLTKDDRDQIFTFVKRLPQGCKAILTSRRRIGSSADTLILEKLDLDAGLATLADIALHNPLLAKTTEAERIALYTQTGGKPLLLRWVAGQLGRGSCRTLDDALHFLRTCPPDNDPLEFIFGDLAEEFTTDEEKVLVSLTYFTLPAKVEHVATVAGLEKPLVETALDTLANRSLVSPDVEEKEYALVPMVAEFLRRHRPAIVAEASNRLVRRSYALIAENGGQNFDRFPALEAAWPTVVPSIPLFIAGPNPRLQIVCEALFHFLQFTGRWDELLSLCQQAEAKAVDMRDFANAGWRAYHAGCVYDLRQQADELVSCGERASDYWQAGDVGPYEHFFLLQLRGNGQRRKGNLPAATAIYLEAIEFYRPVFGETEDVAMILNDLATTERLSGNYGAAEKYFHEAMRVARAVDFAEGLATYSGNLANLALDREHWSDAETLAREALSLSEKLGRKELIAFDCRRIAIALVRQEKAAEALPYAARAVDTFARLGSPQLAEAQATRAECLQQLALQRMTPGWTQNTTALEGNSLTTAEVADALRDAATVLSHRPAEHVAATRAQDSANRMLASFLLRNTEWSKDDLFRLHTALMEGSTVDSLKPIGAWKMEDNGTTVKLDGKTRWNDAYASARFLPDLMKTWLEEFNRRRQTEDGALGHHVWLHATFARIHPFADGNGRMARLLANVPLLSQGRPPVDIPAAARERYLESLARWQLACGPPAPGKTLMDCEDALADFAALCKESLPDASDTV